MLPFFMGFLTRTIWILSLVSFCTDVASEMLYPVMPLYLKSIGYSIVFIGLLEGLAEATASLSKGYFGKWSDAIGKRNVFVQLGYSISGLAKPLVIVSVFPVWVFLMRSLDRLGKGIRTGARDAILAEESTPENKGKVFGFHRSLDTLGAVMGPAIALAYLYFYPEDYRTLFILALAPGALAFLLSLLLPKEKTNSSTEVKTGFSFLSFFQYWKTASPEYRKLVRALLIFALFNSSDVFLLLKAKESGLSEAHVIGLFIFYNLIYAAFAFPLGKWADKIGLKTVFSLGLVLFAIVYGAMSFAHETWQFYVLFFVYGLYSASTEGVSKAWISNLCERNDTATAIGTFAAFQSLAAFAASTMAGIIWVSLSSHWVFLSASIVALGVLAYMQLRTRVSKV